MIRIVSSIEKREYQMSKPKKNRYLSWNLRRKRATCAVHPVYTRIPAESRDRGLVRGVGRGGIVVTLERTHTYVDVHAILLSRAF